MPNRIEVKGYKSIAEVALDLRPPNVLIGPNGAGKSNLLQVFGLLNQIADGRLQVAVRKAGGASVLLHRGPKVTPQLGLRFVEGPNTYEALMTFANDDSLFFEKETYTFQSDGYDKPYEVSLGRGSITSMTRARQPR